MEPITQAEATEAIHDMVGTAANIGSHLIATDWKLDGHRFFVTLAREERNLDKTDHRQFLVTVHGIEDNPVVDNAVMVEKDMETLMDEVALLLIASTAFDHDNKQDLISIFKMLRGEKDTGWKLKTKTKTIEES